MKLEIQNLLLLLIVTFSSLPFSFSGQPQPQAQPQPQPGQSFLADPKIDPKLKEICKQSQEPELCLESYFVYTGEDHPDASINNKAVLRKELEVAKKLTLEFYTKSISFSSQHYGKNKEIYQLYDNCSRNFVLASYDLISAKEALLKKNDMEKVKSGINSAIKYYKTCDTSFGTNAAAPKLEAEQLYKIANVCLSLANTAR